MAIPSSQEWQFSSITPRNSRHHLPVFSEPSRNPSFSSLLCFSSKTFLPRCSTFSSVSASPLQLEPKIDESEEDPNVIISNLFEDPRTEEQVYEYYKKAKEISDFRPDHSTVNLVTRYLVQLKNWAQLYYLCIDFEEFNVLPGGSTCYRLVSSCIRARKYKLADHLLRIFSTDESIAFLAFDAAMKEYNRLHMYNNSIELYGRMKSEGIVLDSGCYCRVMDAYMKLEKYEDVMLVFEEFARVSSSSSSSSFDYKVYLILCESLGRTGRALEALKYFREYIINGGVDHHSFYTCLITSFISIKDLKMAEELLQEAEHKHMVRDPALFLKLVVEYIDQGLMEKAKYVPAIMKRVRIRPSDCILCAIVNGFWRKRGLHSAAKVYEDLRMLGCELGQVTYASVLNIYCKLGMYPKAEMIFEEMIERGFDKCVVAYCTMVTMYGKNGRVDDAVKLVEKMKLRGCSPNVWIYNAVLEIHGKALDLKKVEMVWNEMKRCRVSPDRISYTSIISSYNRAGEVEPCAKYFEEFKVSGGRIDKAMAGIMVAVFSKMNRVDEIAKLLNDLKAEGIELDVRLYRSALNAFMDSGMHLQVKWLQENFEEPKHAG